MLKSIPVLILGLSLSCTVLAAPNKFGPAGSGGGDRCENRIKVIIQDIKAWVDADGGKDLLFKNLRRASDAVDYKNRMQQVLSRPTLIKCVVQGDQDYPVLVNGKPKECRSFVDDSGTNQIICDLKRFSVGGDNPDGESEQYKMIHHEVATLGELELPVGEDSEYILSDQITGYLETKLVKRLSLKSLNGPDRDGIFRMSLDATPKMCAELVAKYYLKTMGADEKFEAYDFSYVKPFIDYVTDYPRGTFKVRDRRNNEIYSGDVYVDLKEAYEETAGMRTYHKACYLSMIACASEDRSIKIKTAEGRIIFSAAPACRRPVLPFDYFD